MRGSTKVNDSNVLILLYRTSSFSYTMTNRCTDLESEIATSKSVTDSIKVECYHSHNIMHRGFYNIIVLGFKRVILCGAALEPHHT